MEALDPHWHRNYMSDVLCTVRIVKNVMITENRQRKVNDYPITVNE